MRIMFTGLVEKLGTLKQRFRNEGGWRIIVSCAFDAKEPPVIGESIAVQGVCLTVGVVTGDGFAADLLDETINRTSLGWIGIGSCVNLERAMKAGDRFGGHIVQGHVDEAGKLQEIRNVGRDYELRISCSSKFVRQCVLKGSVAIDGTSLTITGLGEDYLCVNIIPHTWRATSLSERKVGDKVNLESDIIGKYVERLLGHGERGCGVTEDLLRKAGFHG